MVLSVDSRLVLRAFADHPDAFPAVKGDVDEFARKALGKQIKHKGTDLALARTVRRSAGEDNFATILDGFATNELTTLLKRFDPHNVLVRSDDPRLVRTAIDDLLVGKAEPMVKPEKTPKAPATRKVASATPAKPKIGDLLESKVHSGTPRKPKAKKAS